MSSPEQVTPNIEFHPDSMETPPEGLEGVVETIPSSPSPVPQVSDEGNVITSPQNPSQIPIQIDDSQQRLIAKSKADPSKSSAWRAATLLRFVKQAWHFGRSVIFGRQTIDQGGG